MIARWLRLDRRGGGDGCELVVGRLRVDRRTGCEAFLAVALVFAGFLGAGFCFLGGALAAGGGTCVCSKGGGWRLRVDRRTNCGCVGEGAVSVR